MVIAIKVCALCGVTFKRLDSYSDSQWRKRRFCSRKCGATKRVITDSEIISMYLDDEMSSTEIGDKISLSGAGVLRVLRANKITTRSPRENKKLSQNRPKTRAKMKNAATGRVLSEEAKAKLRVRTGDKNANWRNGLTVTSGGYLAFTASPANGSHRGTLLHNVIAEWKYRRKLLVGEHVHHKDRNKLNNDPGNLVVLSATAHAKIHTIDRENGKIGRLFNVKPV